jgi:hypothetical protein
MPEGKSLQVETEICIEGNMCKENWCSISPEGKLMHGMQWKDKRKAKSLEQNNLKSLEQKTCSRLFQ